MGAGLDEPLAFNDLGATTGAGAFVGGTRVLEDEEEPSFLGDSNREPIAAKAFEGIPAEAWDGREADVTTHLCDPG